MTLRHCLKDGLVGLALASGLVGMAGAADAAGDACAIVGKFIGSATLALEGEPPATSHFDITFAAIEPCEQGTFVANSRVQLLGASASLDAQTLGVYTVTDGFLFIPLPTGSILLGEPAQCVHGRCHLIPFTAAREGVPGARFAGTMGRADVRVEQ